MPGWCQVAVKLFDNLSNISIYDVIIYGMDLLSNQTDTDIENKLIYCQIGPGLGGVGPPVLIHLFHNNQTYFWHINNQTGKD